MKGWQSAVAVGLVFVAQTALADQAKTRDSGPSSSSSAGERHHASSSGSSARSSGSGVSSGSSESRRVHETPSASSSRSSRSSRSEQAEPRPLTEAERRHPRPGTGTGYRHYPYSSYRYGYDPYYSYRYPSYGYYGYWGFSPWYGSTWGWGWDGDWSYGRYSYGYPRARYRYRYYDDDMGSLRLVVEPEETQVLVDGYFAGEVDDFDGIFQRLHVSPGRHEITLKLKGYQTHKIRVYVPRDETLKIHHHMMRGAETVVTEENLVRPWYEGREQQRDRYARRDRNDDDDEKDEAEDKDDDAGESDSGTLRLKIEPRDASVYVDGEFQGAGREVDELDLSPGRHRIEIVRPGYKTAERDVEVKAGRSENLDVQLEK